MTARRAVRRAVRRAAAALAGAALVATTLTASATGTAGPPTSVGSPAARPGCSMPDCYGALAFNARTGFWVTTKNYPTRAAATRKAKQVCGKQRAARHCDVLRVIRGEQCLGAAMAVRDGKVVGHRTAVRPRHRPAMRAAREELSAPRQQRHPIAGVCNA